MMMKTLAVLATGHSVGEKLFLHGLGFFNLRFKINFKKHLNTTKALTNF